jgi:hypothetical protein
MSGNYRKSLHAVAFGNTLHRLIKECAVAMPNRDAATGGQNTIGHRKTDTLSPSGDDRDPLVQIIDIHMTAALRRLRKNNLYAGGPDLEACTTPRGLVTKASAVHQRTISVFERPECLIGRNGRQDL